MGNSRKTKKTRKSTETFFSLKEEGKKLPELSQQEKELVNSEITFKSVYASNRLEGNKLSEKEARKAIMPKD